MSPNICGQKGLLLFVDVEYNQSRAAGFFVLF
jgi:hypothetical protein